MHENRDLFLSMYSLCLRGPYFLEPHDTLLCVLISCNYLPWPDQLLNFCLLSLWLLLLNVACMHNVSILTQRTNYGFMRVRSSVVS